MELSRNGDLSFGEFRRILASELRIDESKVVPEASFIKDLRVDSTRVVDTMLRLENQGIDIPLQLAWQIDTVGDAYQAMLYRGKEH